MGLGGGTGWGPGGVKLSRLGVRPVFDLALSGAPRQPATMTAYPVDGPEFGSPQLPVADDTLALSPAGPRALKTTWPLRSIRWH